jgi:hypothetical protein
VHAPLAGALHGRGQRLRDLGAGGSADPRGRHLAAGPLVPRLAGARCGRQRSDRQLRDLQACGGALPQAPGAGARARARHAAVLALAVRRSRQVPLSGGAAAGAGAGLHPAISCRRVSRPRRRSSACSSR